VMMVFSRVPLTWNVLYFLPVLVVLVLLCFGVGCFLMHFGVYVEDLSHVVTIALRFAYYITGIFYNVEKRIPQWGRLLNQYNPIAFLITSMRQCLLYGQSPDGKMLLFWAAISLVLAIAGVRKIYKEENSYVKAI